MSGCRDRERFTSGNCGKHNTMGWTEVSTSRRPFICPVCLGKGKVPAGFYTAVGVTDWTTSTLQPETCKSCDGKGIVWAP